MCEHELTLSSSNPAKLMQMMVENQRLLTETINQMANQGGRNAPNGPAPNQYSSFKDFMDTKPHLSERLMNPFKLRSGSTRWNKSSACFG